MPQKAEKISPTSERLFVERLSLSNFRNYEQLDLKFSQDSVIITGENGSGKTNLLEAISFLVPGKGIRNAKLATIDKQGANQAWSVFAEVISPEGNVSIGTGRDASKEKDKRIVKIDGEAKRGQAELANHFSICYLTPQMDQTFADGSTSRRNFLDRLSVNFYPDHTKHLSIYGYAKSERRKLLTGHNSDVNWISTLEKRMAEQAVAIASARTETINHLREAINEKESHFPKAFLSIEGTVEKLLEEGTALNAEEQFGQMLKDARIDDSRIGHTTIGPHKSDFIAFHSEKNLPADLCSTGEQKALLLSITMATARARKNWSGSSPVLLLDEVVAHLDSEKRAAFFDELNELSAQSWLTGTDIEFFKDFRGKARFLTVENSTVIG